MKTIIRFLKMLERWLAKSNTDAFDIEVEKHFVQKKKDQQYYDKYENHNR